MLVASHGRGGPRRSLWASFVPMCWRLREPMTYMGGGGHLWGMFRSFPRKRESRAKYARAMSPWVPAFAGRAETVVNSIPTGTLSRNRVFNEAVPTTSSLRQRGKRYFGRHVGGHVRALARCTSRVICEESVILSRAVVPIVRSLAS